jgi:hypothetical protein
MATLNDSGPAVATSGSDLEELQTSEPALLDHWRFERRVNEPSTGSTWRMAVPPELLERLRAKNEAVAGAAAVALPRPQPAASEMVRMAAVEAALAPLPESYRAPYLPKPVAEPEDVIETLGWETEAQFFPEEPAAVVLPPSFKGLDWSTTDNSGRVLVSVRPVLSAALAERVVELLDRAPGMSSVRSLGFAEDIAAFDAEYNGPVDTNEAVEQALKGIGASLVSSGEREFYLAIQGQFVS